MPEYARFGAGWVTREDADYEWEDCPLDDVPAEAHAREAMRAERRRLGYDPYYTNPGPTILPNPAVEAIAEELGLTPGELRGRLNGDTGGTRARVAEARFDEIAEFVGLDPEEARARFRQ